MHDHDTGLVFHVGTGAHPHQRRFARCGAITEPAGHTDYADALVVLLGHDIERRAWCTQCATEVSRLGHDRPV